MMLFHFNFLKRKINLHQAICAVVLIATCCFKMVSAAVVTSIRPLGFIAEAISDGVMPVKVLLPIGASPHDYALRPSDIQAINNASLIVWVDPTMEAFLAKALKSISVNKKITISELPEVQRLLISSQDSGHHEHRANFYNMHLWLSPEIGTLIAINIHHQLLKLHPNDKKRLDENLKNFKNQKNKTIQKIANMLYPVRKKGYFVFHDAYGYFEKQFNLSPLGYFTLNPSIQPGAERLHQIKSQLTAKKAVCIFAEPQFKPAVINALAQGTAVRSGVLDPLGSKIPMNKDSYMKFLLELSMQYYACLK